MKTSQDNKQYSDEYKKNQAEYGKKGKKVGRGYFWQLKQQGKDEELKEIARRGRESQIKNDNNSRNN